MTKEVNVRVCLTVECDTNEQAVEAADKLMGAAYKRLLDGGLECEASITDIRYSCKKDEVFDIK
jgi:hypothetical protein